MDRQKRNELKINSKRLWSRLMSMAEIGVTEKGGCNRQALTDEDKAGRELLMQWCREAGCEVRCDAVGNIFARRTGTDTNAKAVITGSHLDTQPTGGKYDGIYGVLAGLEVIETLNDHAINTVNQIEVVVWTNEEGCRFDMAMMGSAYWSGHVRLEDVYALEDTNGRSVGQELKRIGHKGSATFCPADVKAAFETHIEQGPVLEMEKKTIGVVTGVQHMSRHRVSVEGQEAHAGPTPMYMRRDPVMVLASVLSRIYELGKTLGPESRVTFGVINTRPGSSNTVPGELMFTIDLRHPQKKTYDELVSGAENIVKEELQNYGLNGHMECFWKAPGVEFDESCIDAVRNAVGIYNYPSMSLVSGAGHDACNVAAVVPTSMIFIPCKGGLSHNEAEFASKEDVEAGCNVLLQAILSQSLN